ncbi:DMT family transporter [Hyphomonas adhaerens]|uniref:DMT family transporter n=1 Tax=Hyphomonas adhaerens TaxID=81029 RepID=UPI0023555F39|nr:DMT family transporter [Hyphomonas adhaerens]
MTGPHALAILVMLLWAGCYPFIAMGLSDAPHLTFAALRALLAGGGLLAIAGARKCRLPSSAAEWGWICLTGLSMTSLGYFGMFHASEFVSPGLATIIESLQPMMTAILAFLFLGERPRLVNWTGLVLGAVGVSLVAAPKILAAGGDQALNGMSFVMIATGGVAAGNIAIKNVSASVDASMAMGLQLVIGAVPLALLAAFGPDPLAITWSARFALSLTVLALPGTALAYWLWQKVLQSLDVSEAASFSFLVPLIGVSAGAAFFGETIGGNVALGAMLAALGLYLASSRNPRTSPLPGRRDH